MHSACAGLSAGRRRVQVYSYRTELWNLAFPAMSFHFPFLFSSILSPLAARSAVVAMGTIPRIIPSLPVIQPAAQSQARVIATTPWPLVTGTQSQQGPAQVAQPPMAVANQTMAPTATLLGGSVTASSTSVYSRLHQCQLRWQDC